MAEIIRTENLTKQYAAGVAVDNVNFSMEEGSIMVIGGQDGAGKSTLLRLIAGLVKPTAGSVRLETRYGSRPKIGMLIEYPTYYGNMSARDNLEIRRRACGCKDPEDTDRVMALTGLQQMGKTRAKRFTLDQAMRLGIAMALSGDPELLLLDDPIAGMENANKAVILKMLADLNRDRHTTILITCKNVNEYAAIAPEAQMIRDGRFTHTVAAEPVYHENMEKDIYTGTPYGESTISPDDKKAVGRLEFDLEPVDSAKQVLDSMGIFAYQRKNGHSLHVLEQIWRKDEITARFEEAGVHIYACRVIRETD